MSYLSPDRNTLLSLTLYKKHLEYVFKAHLLRGGYHIEDITDEDLSSMIDIFKSAWIRSGFKIYTSDALFDVFGGKDRCEYIGWANAFNVGASVIHANLFIKHNCVSAGNYDEVVRDIRKRLFVLIDGAQQ